MRRFGESLNIDPNRPYLRPNNFICVGTLERDTLRRAHEEYVGKNPQAEFKHGVPLFMYDREYSLRR